MLARFRPTTVLFGLVTGCGSLPATPPDVEPPPPSAQPREIVLYEHWLQNGSGQVNTFAFGFVGKAVELWREQCDIRIGPSTPGQLLPLIGVDMTGDSVYLADEFWIGQSSTAFSVTNWNLLLTNRRQKFAPFGIAPFQSRELFRGDISFPNIILGQEFDTDSDQRNLVVVAEDVESRVLAHEVGHVFGLADIFDVNLVLTALMYNEWRFAGDSISAGECNTAKSVGDLYQLFD